MAWRSYLANPITPAGTDGSRVTVWYYDDADTANTGAGLSAPGTGTASASTNLITITGHGLSAGQMVVITAITGGAPLVANGFPYFVHATGLTANVFSLATTPAGAVIDITTNATSITARKATPPGNPIHQASWVLPRDRAINDLLPDIDQVGKDARASYLQAAQLQIDAPVGTTRAVPA